MPVDHCNIFREQHFPLGYGHALWEPNPIERFYDQVSIGDVGYVLDGFFHRMFNVTLPSDDPSNQRYNVPPPPYKPLDIGPNIRESKFVKETYYSNSVCAQSNHNDPSAMSINDLEGFTYKCRGHGALLCLPHDGRREDATCPGLFKDYIRDNVESWFEWSKKRGLGIERLEALILISGRTLVTSWGAAVFLDHGQEETAISLAVHTIPNGGGRFVWRLINRLVPHRDSQIEPDNSSPKLNPCIFIKGFRAKRGFPWFKRIRAAAEPRPDDPDDSHEDEIQVTGVPDTPEYRDPLVGVLDCILEKCPEDALAIAHDDDLQLVENKETITADGVEQFLHENDIPVVVEDGVRDDQQAKISTAAELRSKGDARADVLALADFRSLTMYRTTIPLVSERPHNTRWDASKLRELRRKLSSNTVSDEEIEQVAVDFLDGEIVDLASDRQGYTVVRKLFKKCAFPARMAMLDLIGPHLAMIGIHKYGTWAALKIVRCAQTPEEINIIVQHLRPYAPPLLLDQFGNYVIQCCLRFGQPANDFIFDAMFDRLWEIAQGPFGARGIRACLESPNITISQRFRIATAVILNSIPLATNENGKILLTWLLETSGFGSRYRSLAPRFTPHLSHLCTHKLASLTVLRIVNQKVEPEASCQVVEALFSSPNDHVLTDVLRDQVNGVNVVHKVLTSPFIDKAKRPAYIEATKRVLIELKVTATQAYRRLIEEVEPPIPNFQPNYSSGPTTPASGAKGKFSGSPSSYDVPGLASGYSTYDQNMALMVAALQMGGQNPQAGPPQPPQLSIDPGYSNQSVPQRSPSSDALSAFPPANDQFNPFARSSENSTPRTPQRRSSGPSPAAAAATSSTIPMPTIPYGTRSPVLSSAGAILGTGRPSYDNVAPQSAAFSPANDRSNLFARSSEHSSPRTPQRRRCGPSHAAAAVAAEASTSSTTPMPTLWHSPSPNAIRIAIAGRSPVPSSARAILGTGQPSYDNVGPQPAAFSPANNQFNLFARSSENSSPSTPQRRRYGPSPAAAAAATSSTIPMPTTLFGTRYPVLSSAGATLGMGQRSYDNVGPQSAAFSPAYDRFNLFARSSENTQRRNGGPSPAPAAAAAATKSSTIPLPTIPYGAQSPARHSSGAIVMMEQPLYDNAGPRSGPRVCQQYTYQTYQQNTPNMGAFHA